MKRLILFAFLFAAVAAPAADLKLGWAPNPENNIDHYNLHWGTQKGGDYGNVAAVKADKTENIEGENLVTATIPDLTDGGLYYFVLTAVNTDALESLPSDELEVLMALPAQPPSKPAFPIVITITSSGSVTINAGDAAN